MTRQSLSSLQRCDSHTAHGGNTWLLKVSRPPESCSHLRGRKTFERLPPMGRTSQSQRCSNGDGGRSSLMKPTVSSNERGEEETGLNVPHFRTQRSSCSEVIWPLQGPVVTESEHCLFLSGSDFWWRNPASLFLFQNISVYNNSPNPTNTLTALTDNGEVWPPRRGWLSATTEEEQTAMACRRDVTAYSYKHVLHYFECFH